MKEYRVYQNLTLYATTVIANSEEDAIQKAKQLEMQDWDEYEVSDDNIFYDVFINNNELDDTLLNNFIGMNVIEELQKISNDKIGNNKIKPMKVSGRSLTNKTL